LCIISPNLTRSKNYSLSAFTHTQGSVFKLNGQSRKCFLSHYVTSELLSAVLPPGQNILYESFVFFRNPVLAYRLRRPGRARSEPPGKLFCASPLICVPKIPACYYCRPYRSVPSLRGLAFRRVTFLSYQTSPNPFAGPPVERPEFI